MPLSNDLPALRMDVFPPQPVVGKRGAGRPTNASKGIAKMSGAEAQRMYKERRKQKYPTAVDLSGYIIDGAPCDYLVEQWGFRGRGEAIQVALAYLEKHTRAGLAVIDLNSGEIQNERTNQTRR